MSRELIVLLSLQWKPAAWLIQQYTSMFGMSVCLDQIQQVLKINIFRTSNLPLTSSVQIFEKEYGETKLKLVKLLGGGNKKATSVQDSSAQLVTEYSLKPTLYFWYKTLGFQHESYKAIYEYTILRYTSKYISFQPCFSSFSRIQLLHNCGVGRWNLSIMLQRCICISEGTSGDQTYCSALKGYAPTSLICDAHDRISCPDSYDSYIILENPATPARCTARLGNLLFLFRK